MMIAMTRRAFGVSDPGLGQRDLAHLSRGPAKALPPVLLADQFPAWATRPRMCAVSSSETKFGAAEMPLRLSSHLNLGGSGGGTACNKIPNTTFKLHKYKHIAVVAVKCTELTMLFLNIHYNRI